MVLLTLETLSYMFCSLTTSFYWHYFCYVTMSGETYSTTESICFLGNGRENFSATSYNFPNLNLCKICNIIMLLHLDIFIVIL